MYVCSLDLGIANKKPISIDIAEDTRVIVYQERFIIGTIVKDRNRDGKIN